MHLVAGGALINVHVQMGTVVGSYIGLSAITVRWKVSVPWRPMIRPGPTKGNMYWDNRVVPQTEKFNKTQPITRLTIKSLIRLKEQTDAYRRETDDNDRIINYVILLNLFPNAFTNK